LTKSRTFDRFDGSIQVPSATRNNRLGQRERKI
jgi:hypothetical protein